MRIQHANDANVTSEQKNNLIGNWRKIKYARTKQLANVIKFYVMIFYSKSHSIFKISFAMHFERQFFVEVGQLKDTELADCPECFKTLTMRNNSATNKS